jgi:AraC-like DNA-binding protein
MTATAEHLPIPSTYSRIVARELGLQERDLPQLLRGTGLSTDILLPGDETQMTGLQQLQVLENAWRMGNVPEFGLRLGQQLQPSAHGPLGYLTLSSPDIITALVSLREFLPGRIPFAQLTLHQGPEWLDCSLDILLPAQPEERRMLLECFVLLVQSMVEALLRRQLTEAHIQFDFPEPGYSDAYPDYLHSPYAFSQPHSCIRLPAALARVSNVAGDSEAYALAELLCRRMLEQSPATVSSISDRVRRLLLSQPAGSLNEEDVARAMYVSRRTLTRRLEKEGSTFRGIREMLMAELAARHLQESDSSVEAVAASLGYHDASNFRRAFRRWYGVTPGAYRRHRSSGAQ